MADIYLPLSAPMVRAYQHNKKTQTRRLRFRGKPGDIIHWKEALVRGDHRSICYEADGVLAAPGRGLSWPWQRVRLPSIFCPHWAIRYRSEVLDVREQRLQDITEQDAKAEGLTCIDPAAWVGTGGHFYMDPRLAYRDVWDPLSGKKPGYRWADNPLIKAVSFRRLS